MINWKTIVGAILISLAVKEYLSIKNDVNIGIYKSMPSGVAIGFFVLLVLGFFLIIKGIKKN